MLRSLCRHRATEAKRRPTSSKVLQKNILLGLVLHFHSWPCDLCPYIQVGWFHFLRSPFWSICELEICLLLIKKLSSEVFTLFSRGLHPLLVSFQGTDIMSMSSSSSLHMRSVSRWAGRLHLCCLLSTLTSSVTRRGGTCWLSSLEAYVRKKTFICFSLSVKFIWFL